MSAGFRQSQSSLHTWSGLIVGWVLFTIFLMGTVSYWREDINRWMRPELAGAERPEQVVAGAVAYLRDKAPDAKNWFISVPGKHEAGASLFWQPRPVEGQPPRRGRRDTQALVGAD
ncbi:PepSY-associated TM helix domain-containing protein, partial [Sphingobium jiangsuense]